MTGLQIAEEGHWHPHAAQGHAGSKVALARVPAHAMQLLGEEGLLTSLSLGKRALQLVEQGWSGLFCHCSITLE